MALLRILLILVLGFIVGGAIFGGVLLVTRRTLTAPVGTEGVAVAVVVLHVVIAIASLAGGFHFALAMVNAVWKLDPSTDAEP